MRRSTIVVAMFAATVASAGATPVKERLGGGASVHNQIKKQSVSTSAQQGSSKQAVNAAHAPVVPVRTRSTAAAAFTSARNAAPAVAPTPAPVVAEKVAPRRVRVAAKSHAAPKRIAMSRAAARRLAAKSQPVSLERDVEIMPAKPTVAAAALPTGPIRDMVTAAAQRQGVDPSLAHAVVQVESMYKPQATGAGGFIGLMQLSYRTARGMGFRGSRQALYEPSNNLTYGMRYLAEAVRKSGGNTCAAVSKYQGGHAVKGVTRAGAVYCAKVKRFMAARGGSANRRVASN
ncbi:lytic transglycosylase domain-containing protein [Hansschlegelia sp.]|uniref:lytic transglycosylase domain-containing protein n=1 Tax=Hansschlegelia sp. TaxID=2041892 RepID=UPI002C6199A9|nr:transglycosylase SLT domain-containing protein [Hansschlegelia sp.]HVI28441.1 transglycosylase SLT domain-containing protein [Hansschlegelia sp.]